MGGHHKMEFPEMPDFRKYNVEDVPVLLEVQKKLAQHGLRDPWLRNEVWKYRCEPYNPHITKIFPILFKGFKYGVLIAIAATAVSKSFARKGDH